MSVNDEIRKGPLVPDADAEDKGRPVSDVTLDVFQNRDNNDELEGRTRTLTTKGKAFQLQTAARSMKTYKKRLTKQTGIVDTLLTGFNADLVNSEVASIEKTYGEFTDSYARSCEIVGETEEEEEGLKQLQTEIGVLSEEVDNLYLECKEKVCQWSLQQEKAASELPRKSTKSGSSHSRSSK